MVQLPEIGNEAKSRKLPTKLMQCSNAFAMLFKRHGSNFVLLGESLCSLHSMERNTAACTKEV
jgi:hypothetical protein